MNDYSKNYIIKNDALFGKIFHEINRMRCIIDAIIPVDELEKYGKCEGRCEMAHLIPRSNFLYRWDLGFVFPLCGMHHRESSLFSEHKTPKKFDAFLEEYFNEKFIIVIQQRYAINKLRELPFTFIQKYEELEIIDNGEYDFDKLEYTHGY